MRSHSDTIHAELKEQKVFVFKTNIQSPAQTKKLNVFDNVKGITEWSTDLEDCDNILRVVGGNIKAEKIIWMLDQLGFHCEELSYS